MPAPDTDFVAWFRDQMAIRKLSQAAVARLVGADPVQVMRWRRGEARPGLEYMEKIAQAFGIERDTLKRLIYGDAITTDSEQEATVPDLDAKTQAELDAYRVWYDGLIRNKVPRGMWRAYTEACDQLADSFNSVGTTALNALPAEMRDGPEGAPLRPITRCEIDALWQLVAA